MAGNTGIDEVHTNITKHTGTDKQGATTTTNDPAFDKGKPNSHALNDPKDQRSLEKRAEAEKEAEKREAEAPPPMTGAEIARSKGREPSKGARIDEEIAKEEEEELRRKGKI
ncbi:hypothetical protein WJX73_001815 [Symbiochloris irregularis]|uniref:Uncharacterized protein n=1 Tax=Symbiochloris irregularis TaxID=706552 RepID=A0AAW1PJ11_9CHLO